MTVKRFIACIAAMCLLTINCFAANIVTDFSEDAFDSLTVIDGHSSEQREIVEEEDSEFELLEYENGITITAPSSTITTSGGTLQLTATITEPMEGESYIWSIESGSNCATIDQNGLVTAVTNGTVVCKVHSTMDSTKIAYKTIVIAIKTETQKISVGIMGVGGTQITGSINGESRVFGSMNTASYDDGTEFVLKVTPKEGYEFIYWKNFERIVSFDPEYSFTLGSAMNLSAVCGKTDGSNLLVTFKDMSGNVLIEGYTSAEIKTPTKPFTLGYKFHCWVADGNMYNFTPNSVLDTSNIAKNTMFSAGYIKDSTEYTVTATGADSTGGTYMYNDLVVLNPAEPEEGKRFAYWKRDGKIVSYDETYKFYVGAFDTHVEAVFVDIGEAVAEVPIIVMSEPQVVDGNKISFVAERYLPERYTLASTGIILSNSSSNITLNMVGVTHSQANSTTNKGQYTIRKKDVRYGEIWYARGYMIYKDGDNLITIYSDPVAGKR